MRGRHVKCPSVSQHAQRMLSLLTRPGAAMRRRSSLTLLRGMQQGHHWLGRAIVALAVVNVFLGLHVSMVRASLTLSSGHLRTFSRLRVACSFSSRQTWQALIRGPISRPHCHAALQEYHRFWWGYGIILFAIVMLGVVKELIDWRRLGLHHTSLRDKVRHRRQPLLPAVCFTSSRWPPCSTRDGNLFQTCLGLLCAVQIRVLCRSIAMVSCISSSSEWCTPAG